MILGTLLLATLLTTEPTVAVVAVRLDTSAPRPAIRVECSGPSAGLSVERVGNEVIIRIALPIAGPIVAPKPRGIVEGVRVSREDGVVVVSVRVDPTVPFEIDRSEACLAVLFGERPPDAHPSETAQTAEAGEPADVKQTSILPAQQTPETPSPEARTEGVDTAASSYPPSAPGLADGGQGSVEPEPATVPEAASAPSGAPLPQAVETTPATEAPVRPVVVAVGATPSGEPPGANPPAVSSSKGTDAPSSAGTVTTGPRPVDPRLLFAGATAPSSPRLTPYDYLRLFPGRDLEQTPVVQGGLTAPREPMSVQFKFLTLRPSLVVALVDSETILLDTNQVVRDRFLQVQPGLGAGSPLAVGVSALDGRLRLGYEPRFRLLSHYSLGTTHVADAVVDLPVGPRAKTLAAYRYFNGILETTLADPGREYFFHLGRYERHEVTLGARYEIGPRLGVDGGFGWTQVDFDEKSDFFPYETRSLRAGFNYDLTPDKRVFLHYTRQETPPSPERPVVASTSNQVSLEVQGSFGLTNGEAAVGFRDVRAPNAAAGGDRFQGLVGRARLSRDLFVDTRAELFLERAPWLSAWEDNAFYIANMAQLRLTTPLPWSFYGTALGAWQRNTYRTTSPTLAGPRQDELLGWAVGLGRTLTRWAFFRADYRKDYRDSNVPGYSIDTRSFVVQFGIGAFGEIGADGRVRGGAAGGGWR